MDPPHPVICLLPALPWMSGTNAHVVLTKIQATLLVGSALPVHLATSIIAKEVIWSSTNWSWCSRSPPVVSLYFHLLFSHTKIFRLQVMRRVKQLPLLLRELFSNGLTTVFAESMKIACLNAAPQHSFCARSTLWLVKWTVSGSLTHLSFLTQEQS